MKYIVRAVDIGYGNTKFTLSHQPGQDITCKMFPSLAPRASDNGDLGAGMLAKRETIKVEVNGVQYEVGPDADLAQDGVARDRHLFSDYCRSDGYMALLKGALHQMGVSRIDLLALGLPVSTYADFKQELMKRATGSHQCGNRIVHVANVRVYPQPLGGFFDYAIRANLFAQMSREINLLIDPGFFTLDWLVTSGIKTLDGRSGAAEDGGMSSVLRVIAKAIAKDHSCKETSLRDVDVDAALRGDGTMRLFGNSIDINKYRAVGGKKAEDAIKIMAQTVGDAGNIDNIVLVGGGSHFYLDPLKARFPKHSIAVAHDPVFANVRGFQFIAEERMRQLVSASAGVAA